MYMYTINSLLSHHSHTHTHSHFFSFYFGRVIFQIYSLCSHRTIWIKKRIVKTSKKNVKTKIKNIDTHPYTHWLLYNVKDAIFFIKKTVCLLTKLWFSLVSNSFIRHLRACYKSICVYVHNSFAWIAMHCNEMNYWSLSWTIQKIRYDFDEQNQNKIYIIYAQIKVHR